MSQKWKWTEIVALLAVVLVAILLRFANLGYGIGTLDRPHKPYNGDEVYSMNGMSTMVPSKLYFNPVSGHREGAVGYYMWMSAYLPMRAIGYLKTFPHVSLPGDTNYNKALYLGRVVVALSDVLIVLLTFFITLRITQARVTGVFAAAIVAVIPYEIILAQEMRPHTLSNLWTYLLLFLALSSYDKNRGLRYWAFLGAIAGVSAATRYHMAFNVGMPILFWLFRRHFIEGTPWKQLHKSIFSKQIGVVFLAAIGTFVLVDPYLFFEFKKATPDLQFQASFASTSQFKGWGIFDLSRLWSYFIYGIPYGTGPLLAILFYFCTVYTLSLRQYRRFALPIAVFFLLFYYYVVKLYYFMPPCFYSVRAVSVIFPAFSIFTAIALMHLWNKYQSIWSRFFIMVVVTAAILPAMWMTGAYIRSNNLENDPNSQFYSYISAQKMESGQKLKVGYWSASRNYAIPQVELLQTQGFVNLIDLHQQTVERFNETFISSAPDIDYLLLSNLYFGVHQLDPAWIVPALEKTGKFKLERVFDKRFEFLGIEYPMNEIQRPIDYPFPLKLYLLRRLKT
jgi:hypothetical protein